MQNLWGTLDTLAVFHMSSPRQPRPECRPCSSVSLRCATHAMPMSSAYGRQPATTENESPLDLSFHFASQAEARPAHLKICACAWTCNFLEQLPQTWHLLFPGDNTNSHLICSAYRPTQKIVNADSEVSRDMSSHLIHDSLTLVAWSCLSDVQVFPHNDRSKLRMASRQAHL